LINFKKIEFEFTCGSLYLNLQIRFLIMNRKFQQPSSSILEKGLNKLINISSYTNENVFYEVIKTSNEVLSTNRSSIWIQQQDTLKCQSIYPYFKELQDIKIPYINPEECKKKLQSHRPFLLDLNDNETIICKSFRKYIDKKTTKTILITPIIIKSQIIGIVANASSRNINEWNLSELDFAMVVASIVALHLQLEQKQQEDKKNQDMKSLLNHSDTIIFHWSASEGWPVLSVTSNISIFGYIPEDFLDNKISYSSIIYKDDLEKVSKEIEEYLKNNIDNFKQVYRIRTRDNDIRWIEDSTIVQRDKENEVIGFLGIIHDITKKRALEQNLKENEEKFRAMIESSLSGAFIYRDTYIYTNKAFENMTGYSTNELRTMPPEFILEKKLQEKFHEIVQQRMQGKLLSQSDYQNVTIVRKNGERRIVRITVSTIKYQGDYAGAGTIMDITDLMKEKKVHNLLARALKQTDDIVYITDVNGNITYVNDSTLKNYGYAEEELLGKNAKIFASGKYEKSFYKEFWNTILTGKNCHYIMVNHTKEGKLLYEEKVITPILNENNEIESFVSTATNITKRIELEKKLEKMAIIDNLTNLYNRHKINEVINNELEKVKRYNENIIIVMFDIDHFKHVNDTYGHDVGDEVLKFLSQIVLKSIRKVDTVGRWGGEEFIVVLSHIDLPHAYAKVESIRKKIENSLIDGKCKITVSFGVTQFLQTDTTIKLLKRVDDTLYEAKKSGRNTVVVK